MPDPEPATSKQTTACVSVASTLTDGTIQAFILDGDLAILAYNPRGAVNLRFRADQVPLLRDLLDTIFDEVERINEPFGD